MMNMFSEICSQFFGAEEIMDKEIVFDNVKYEKEKAMARFNMFQRMKKLLQVFELLILLVLISWSTKKIPSAVEFSGKFLFELVNCLKKPHVVFVMVIFIVLVLVVLCKDNDVGNESNGDDFEKVYDLHNNDFTKSITTEKLHEIKEEEIKIVNNEMQIVVANEDDHRDAVEVAIEEAGKRIRRFERTQSEKLRRDIGVRKTKELRRSETENSRLVVRGSGGERRIVKSGFNTVDHLSNEEFKLAVDDFINKHRVFFKEQKIAEFNFN